MTLIDHETKRDIVNPYITLFGPEDSAWCALNTETFRDAQNEIINIHDEQTYIKYAWNEKSRLYKVVATVGKQDHPLDYKTRNMWTRGVRVDGVHDAMALVPLGYIMEDVVKELFPLTFKFFESLKGKKINP
jgi:hypothetical protein